MDQVLIVRYGEISLKGLNRSFFEDRLLSNIKKALKPLGNFELKKSDSRIYVDLPEKEVAQVIETVKKVFGVVSVSVAKRFPADFETIARVARQVMADELDNGEEQRGPVTFKVDCKRVDKNFPMGSLEVSREVGAAILDFIPGLQVDVHRPQITVYVELRDFAYVYAGKIQGFGGMPYGTNGKALLLLSGGIDSPVAGWLAAKRGVEIEAVHFHSFPFTSERAKEKVIDLARILSRYCRRLSLTTVNLLEIQRHIKENCPEEIFTILSRRFMMFLGERVALQHQCEALVTGESIGQVASQTIPSLHVTNAAVSLPVLRPLITMDKMEIVDWAVKIGTYETSILPYEDCCTVFLPDRPATKPRLEKVLKHEAKLDRETLLENALAAAEIIEVTPGILYKKPYQNPGADSL